MKNVNELIQLVDELRQRFNEVINDIDYFSFSTLPACANSNMLRRID